MCGRCASSRGPEDLARLFGVTEWHPEETLAPSWNVAPADDVWAVLERAPRGGDEGAPGRRRLRPLRWGRSSTGSWRRSGRCARWFCMTAGEVRGFRGPDERGVFAVRRAIEQVAARLGISRVSAYSYLSQARAAAGASAGGATTDTTPSGGHA